MTTQSFDASHSRSAFEAELANPAAKRSKTEHGVSIKKARNIDNHALTDSLSNMYYCLALRSSIDITTKLTASSFSFIRNV
jgi:hypothetical protein